MTMMDPGEYLDWSYPDHDDDQPHHGPGGDEVEAEAELPAAAASLVLAVVQLLPHQVPPPTQLRHPP